jgi:hypothetical protein
MVSKPPAGFKFSKYCSQEMPSKKKVTFIAQRTVSKPVKVQFRTREGLVSFKATKKISKPVKVTFYVEKKKGKR